MEMADIERNENEDVGNGARATGAKHSVHRDTPSKSRAGLSSARVQAVVYVTLLVSTLFYVSDVATTFCAHEVVKE
jgi:hypothetical protein